MRRSRGGGVPANERGLVTLPGGRRLTALWEGGRGERMPGCGEGKGRRGRGGDGIARDSRSRRESLSLAWLPRRSSAAVLCYRSRLAVRRASHSTLSHEIEQAPVRKSLAPNHDEPISRSRCAEPGRAGRWATRPTITASLWQVPTFACPTSTMRKADSPILCFPRSVAAAPNSLLVAGARCNSQRQPSNPPEPLLPLSKVSGF